MALVALCLLSQNYSHAAELIKLFTDIDVTIDLLTEIDRLVQLFESPIFACQLFFVLRIYRILSYFGSGFFRRPSILVVISIAEFYGLLLFNWKFLDFKIGNFLDFKKVEILVADLRLHMLDPSHQNHIAAVLYGFLMLLPQTEAFHALHRRLQCLPLTRGSDIMKDKLELIMSYSYCSVQYWFFTTSEHFRKFVLWSLNQYFQLQIKIAWKREGLDSI